MIFESLPIVHDNEMPFRVSLTLTQGTPVAVLFMFLTSQMPVAPGSQYFREIVEFQDTAMGLCFLAIRD